MAYKRVFNGCAILDTMTANLQQRQRERGDISRPERGSVTRSDVRYPPASPPQPHQPARSVPECGGPPPLAWHVRLLSSTQTHSPTRIKVSWTAVARAAPKRSEGGSAATTPLSLAQIVPESSRAPRPHHSSFVILPSVPSAPLWQNRPVKPSQTLRGRRSTKPLI